MQETMPSKCRVTFLIVKIQIPSSEINLILSDSVSGIPLTNQDTYKTAQFLFIVIQKRQKKEKKL